MKVSDQATESTDDDRVVGGARFDLHLDDGDEAYEPDGDDAPVLASIEAERGFAVFHPTSPGHYWVTEARAPDGLAAVPPVLIAYSGSPDEECGWFRGKMACRPDVDGNGGFVVVVVKDPPDGSTEAATGGANLPPTDTASVAPPTTSRSTMWFFVAVFCSSLLAFSAVIRRRDSGGR